MLKLDRTRGEGEFKARSLWKSLSLSCGVTQHIAAHDWEGKRQLKVSMSLP
jgi:hypothetical protein